METNGHLYTLKQDEELRIEVECPKNETITIELKSGTAEIFGTEMVMNTKYKFLPGTNFSIFTYHGCQVLILGNFETSPYASKETPMIMYLNTHAALEEMRKDAERKGKRGPVFMVVGPTDVGKSTLCRLFLNYAVRMGRRPIYVDLDVGQGSISLPGTIGSILVERPASIDENGFSQNAPLVYHFGQKSPGQNTKLYKLLVSKLSQVVRQRLDSNKKADASGIIINTCGWIRGEGYDLIKHIAKAFEVDVITVLDQERVYNDLKKDMPDFVKIMLQPKSGGVVNRSQSFRIQGRDLHIKRYFYGRYLDLFPHSFDMSLSDLKNRIYRVGGPRLPNSCLPLGAIPEPNYKTKLIPVN
uniref:Protein CLP1 homolog n=1 Tax=Lepeophtheirus salmonis TaxID=72036 RepID=A0A0K2UR56_LEPSM